MRDWIHFYCEPKGSNVFCFNAIMEAITRDQGALKENVNLIFFLITLGEHQVNLSSSMTFSLVFLFV